VIRRKTATLFAAGTRCAGILSDSSETEQQALFDYGMALGEAFQITDDVLDYSASAEAMGKNVGDDLAEGKPTLPLIYAMQEGSREDQDMIRRAIEAGGLEQIDAILKALNETGALNYCHQQAVKAAERAESALTPLPDSPHREALAQLARFSVERAS